MCVCVCVCVCVLVIHSDNHFSEINKFMTSKIVVLVFRNKLDVSENKVNIDFKKCEYYSSLEINK